MINFDQPQPGHEPRSRRDAKIFGLESRADADPARAALAEDLHRIWLAALDGEITSENTDLLKDLFRRGVRSDLSPNDAEYLLSVASGYLKSAASQGGPIDLRELQPELEWLRQVKYGAQAERPRVETARPAERREYRPDERTVQDVRDFLDFADTGVIESRLAQGSASVEDVIYNEFYSVDPRGDRFQPGDPEYGRVKANYDRDLESLQGWIGQMQLWLESQDNLLGLIESQDMKERGWVYLKGNGGFDHGRPIGRAYLNIQVENLTHIFAVLFEKLRTAGAHFEMKITNDPTIDELNRPDKMVLYFNDDGQEQVKRALREIYGQFQGSFDASTPRFTAPLMDVRGQRMDGVSFGEQPKDRSESFGGIRAKILANVYRQAKQLGLSMRDPDFRLADRFQAACLAEGVDPENTSRNLTPDRQSELGYSQVA